MVLKGGNMLFRFFLRMAVAMLVTGQCFSMVSDDFSDSELDSQVWEFSDPKGDCTVRINGSQVCIDLPAGSNHDLWPYQNFAPRLIQNCNSGNIDVEVKFDSFFYGSVQSQGILIEEDSENYLRLDLFFDGEYLRVFSAAIINNIPIKYNTVIVNNFPPFYLRVKKTGNEWKNYFSADGQDWEKVSQFIQNLKQRKAGIFAVNYSEKYAPEFSCIIDYFMKRNEPVIPEDEGLNTITICCVGNGTVTKEPSRPYYEEGENVLLMTEPGENSEFAGFYGDYEQISNPLEIEVDSDIYLLAYFEQMESAVDFDIWYGLNQKFGHLGNPQVWVNVLGNISNPAGLVRELEYSLNGGSYSPLTIGADTRRLCDDGDFVIEIDYLDLAEGQNQVEIKATDDEGFTSYQNVSLDYEGGNIWPGNYNIDWSSSTNIQNLVQVVDGEWALTGGGLRTIQIGYDRAFVFGDIYWENYEFTLSFTVYGFDPDGFNYPSNHPGFGTLVRWQGHTDNPVNCGQPNCGWLPHGSSFWFDWDSTGGYGADIGGSLRYTGMDPLDYGVKYFVKMKVETIEDKGNLYSLKMWQEGESEPGGWFIEKYRTPDVTNGSVLVLAHHVDVLIDDIIINNLDDNVEPPPPPPPEDTTPPELFNISAFAGRKEVTISWSTDEAAASTVKLGTSSAYEIGTFEDPILKTSHSILIDNLTEDTVYHYKVISEDSAGNRAESTDKTFTTLSDDIPEKYFENFESYNTGSDPARWFDTDAGNSMQEDDSLFEVSEVEGQKSFGTSSKLINIHSHYLGQGSPDWSNYEYTGRMKVTDGYSGIGVTFLSDYPNSDSYYRLRKEKGGTFHISPHGTKITGGDKDTGVSANVNKWYWFRIDVENTGSVTNIYAKVWADGDNEPSNWQATCSDSSTSRLFEGTVGIWSMLSGNKYWDDLQVVFEGEEPPLPPPPPDDTTPPVISDIFIDEGTTTADVSWKTDEPAEGEVSYGLTSSYELGSITETSFKTEHNLQISGLVPETDYHLKIKSTDQAGNEAFSNDLPFSTGAVSQGYFEGFEVYDEGDDPAGWYDTDAYNSMQQDDSLYKIFLYEGQAALGTSSSLINIHSHYINQGSSDWMDYTFTGKMMTSNVSGGIGVTFLSDYPNSDSYYRLRMEKGKSFRIEPHGTQISGGDKDSGIFPLANVWYRFKIQVSDIGIRTEIKAKVWREGSGEPALWQIDCFDENPGRRVKGTIGTWSMRSGFKYWDDFGVIFDQ